MNQFDKLYAEMTKAERAAPATRGDLTQFIAMLLRHIKSLDQRIKQLEKGEHA
jgi:hypothetical protein